MEQQANPEQIKKKRGRKPNPPVLDENGQPVVKKKMPQKKNSKTWNKNIPSPNPTGAPKKFKSIEELTAFMQEKFREIATAYVVNGKIFTDIEQMHGTKRFENMMKMIHSFVPNLSTTPEGEQPQLNDVKIQVVLGNGQPRFQPQTIELKTKDNNTYEA